ncbi:MAG: c-type cytochrome [Opitutia bacterium]
MRPSSLLALLASAALLTAAEDGAQVYNTLCVACHGPDGKGLNGLPPLVGSEWPKGPAERSIKISLNGMTGPVEVAGKAYNSTCLRRARCSATRRSPRRSPTSGTSSPPAPAP